MSSSTRKSRYCKYYSIKSKKYFSIGLANGLAGNLGKLIGQAGGLGGANNANANAKSQQISDYLQKFNDNSANATGMPS
ncbi:hypothetical protein [Helicobacter mustelae]|uniref:Putative Hsr recombination casette n=1 Tax=Helicobacter mustelae (strain ATCC 43772 / CCUG 25715 / CIP 103759 / LMG 18044 / NCTC 12198 / R85-136P) TaxID=679897 RepID=D3UI04_HELM1|nr:hypothetical protein [Helicobacter mustelae]CBG40127.1 putative Hsr recombination casette [Helicobacter mustelae 12198]SQH71633.1 Hsr recombination casette protein [Helicobacter mustelae]